MKRRYVVFAMSAFLALALAVPALGGPSNPVADVSATAKKTAKKALKRAKAAQQSADQAQNTANQAENAAENAQSTADGAQTAAQNAQAAAEAAQATADSKFGDTIQRVGAGTAVDSNTPKTDTATCSAGEQPTGGGWFSTGTGDNDITPQFNANYGQGWIVTQEEIGGGTADTWGFTTQIMCAQTQ
jgi:hypothetical protein